MKTKLLAIMLAAAGSIFAQSHSSRAINNSAQYAPPVAVHETAQRSGRTDSRSFTDSRAENGFRFTQDQSRRFEANRFRKDYGRDRGFDGDFR
jgi:hypothetical protein